MYASPGDPTPLVGIQWHLSSSQETGDTKYTQHRARRRRRTGLHLLGHHRRRAFDAFFDIYNKGQDNLARIEWSRTAENGRVTDPGHYGDQDWHCWDTGHNDIACFD